MIASNMEMQIKPTDIAEIAWFLTYKNGSFHRYLTIKTKQDSNKISN